MHQPIQILKEMRKKRRKGKIMMRVYPWFLVKYYQFYHTLFLGSISLE